MALLFMDSVRHYTDPLHKYDSVGLPAQIAVNATASSRGGPALVFSGATATLYLQRNIAARATGTAALRFKRSLLSDQCILLEFYSGSTRHVSIRSEVNGSIGVYRDNALLGQTGPGLIVADSFAHLAVQPTIADAPSGAVEVWVNGKSVLTLSGADTRNAALASFDNVRWSRGGSTTVTSHDIYLDDAAGAFPGDIGIEGLAVNGAGYSAQFTPSAGANHQNVDDAAPDEDATYNESSTVGHIDSFALANLTGLTPTTPAAILAVQHVMRARKTDAASRELRALVRHGGVNGAGASKALATGYQTLTEIFATNPSTGSAWTLAEIDAMEAGVEVMV